MPKLWTRPDRDSIRHGAVTAVLIGILLLLAAVALLAWPELTGTAVMTIIGAVLLIAGLVLLYGAWRLRDVSRALWLVALVPAVVVAAFGLVVLVWPDVVSDVVLIIVAIIAVLAGVVDIAMSLALARVVPWWWVRLLRGLLLAGAGVWALFNDVSGLAVLGAVVAIWAFVLGALSVASGILALRES